MWVDVYLCSLARDFSKKIDNKKEKKEKMSSIHKKQIKSRVHPAPLNVWVQWCLHIPPRNRTEASRLFRTASHVVGTLTPVTREVLFYFAGLKPHFGFLSFFLG